MSEVTTPAPMNTPSGPEKVQSRANSNVTFDDIANMENAEAEKKPSKAVPAKKADEKGDKKKTEAKEKDSAKDAVEEDGDDEEAKPEKAKKKPGEEEEDSKDSDGDQKEGKKGKPKAHKFRSGDETTSIKGDSVISVPVDGKDEDVPLQTLVDQYSGKVAYDRKFSELAREKTEHTKSVGELNGLVDDLFKRSSENPEEAWDHLADLTGKDPVEIKMGLLKSQLKAFEEYYQIPTVEGREAWLKDQERSFRDRKYNRRDEAEKKKGETARRQKEESDCRAHFGISEDEYAKAEAEMSVYFKQNNVKTPMTSQHVVYAHRFGIVNDAIKEAAPHLANDKNFDTIVDDIVQDAMKHPKMTRDKIAKLLREVFPPKDDQAGLRRLGRKVGANEEQTAPKSQKKEPVLFSDLDD